MTFARTPPGYDEYHDGYAEQECRISEKSKVEVKISINGDLQELVTYNSPYKTLHEAKEILEMLLEELEESEFNKIF